MQIPLYQQNIAPTTQSPAAMADPNAAAAPFKALAQLGNVASDVAFDYADRRQKLKEKADQSDYNVELKNFETNLINAKSDAMKSGVGYQNMHSEVVAPMMEEFNQSLSGRGYSKKSMANIQEQWAFDSASIAQSEAVDREKMEIADYTYRIQTEADSILASGDFEGADAKYDELSGIVGEKAVGGMKSLGRYNYYTISQQGLESNRLDGLLTDDEYFKGLQDLNKEAKDSGMEMNHQKAIEISSNAKINNFKGSRVKALTKANDDVFEKIAKDELEVEDLAIIRNDVGPEMANALDSSLSARLETSAKAGDEDAIKSLKYLDAMVNGDDSWPDAVEKIGNLNSSTGVLALSVANKYAKDIVNTQESFRAYENLFRKDKFISVDADTKDYVHTLTYYNSRKTDGQAEFINNKMKAFAKWQEGGDQTYAEFRTKQFGEDAKRDVSVLNSPQVGTARLEKGTIEEGYEFLGGDRNVEANWRKL